MTRKIRMCRDEACLVRDEHGVFVDRAGPVPTPNHAIMLRPDANPTSIFGMPMNFVPRNQGVAVSEAAAVGVALPSAAGSITRV